MPILRAFLLNLSCHMAPEYYFPVGGTASFNNLLQLSLHQKYKNLWPFGYLLFLVFYFKKFLSAPFHHITFVKTGGGGVSFLYLVKRKVVKKFYMMWGDINKFCPLKNILCPPAVYIMTAALPRCHLNLL